MDSITAVLDIGWLAPALVGAAACGVLVLTMIVIWRFPDLAVLVVRLGPFRLCMINKVGNRED
jgi:hypothetical protein